MYLCTRNQVEANPVLQSLAEKSSHTCRSLRLCDPYLFLCLAQTSHPVLSCCTLIDQTTTAKPLGKSMWHCMLIGCLSYSGGLIIRSGLLVRVFRRGLTGRYEANTVTSFSLGIYWLFFFYVCILVFCALNLNVKTDVLSQPQVSLNGVEYTIINHFP